LRSSEDAIQAAKLNCAISDTFPLSRRHSEDPIWTQGLRFTQDEAKEEHYKSQQAMLSIERRNSHDKLNCW